jgi:hypothetical protein
MAFREMRRAIERTGRHTEAVVRAVVVHDGLPHDKISFEQ